jgi:hypothetical protein
MGQRNKKYTQEEFVQLLKSKQPDVDVVGVYMGAHKPILLHCQKHDIYYSQHPSKALIGQSGCDICATIKGKRHRKTHDTFVKELYELSPTIEILSLYINNNEHVKCRCRTCEHEWSASPSNLLAGKGCIKCSTIRGTMKRTKCHEDFLRDLKQIDNTIMPLEEYVNAFTNFVPCIACFTMDSLSISALI